MSGRRTASGWCGAMFFRSQCIVRAEPAPYDFSMARTRMCPTVGISGRDSCVCLRQDLEAWAGSGSGASSLLVDQQWFLWLVKVALACIVVGTGCAFLITLFLCARWSGAELDGDRLVRDERGKQVDSKKSKTMSTNEMMDDMTTTFREISPPDPDAMRRAMESDGDGSGKLVPTRSKRGLAMVVVVRGVLNFYTVFASFQDAMSPRTIDADPNGEPAPSDYIISRRVIAFMETVYVAFHLCQALYGIVYLTTARFAKLDFKVNQEPTAPNRKHFDRTEDAHKYVAHLIDAASFSMIKCLPSRPKVSRLISWAKYEGKAQLELCIENGKTLRRTSRLRFFFRSWALG
eukprot:COSAG02_NODE_14517_length_1263_cov_1.855670_1_plen_346_part_01